MQRRAIACAMHALRDIGERSNKRHGVRENGVSVWPFSNHKDIGRPVQKETLRHVLARHQHPRNDKPRPRSYKHLYSPRTVDAMGGRMHTALHTVHGDGRGRYPFPRSSGTVVQGTQCGRRMTTNTSGSRFRRGDGERGRVHVVY